MAPKRKNDDGEEPSKSKPPVAKTTRETRSSARTTSSMSKGTSSSSALHQVCYERRNKKTKTSAVKVKQEKDDGEKSGVIVKKEKDVGEKSGRTIEIEHRKQCSSFKNRANQVKNALEDEVSCVKVVPNPEEPRKGCFEIREPGGATFNSLVDMKRTFTPMKEVKMEDVIVDIVKQLKQ